MERAEVERRPVGVVPAYGRRLAGIVGLRALAATSIVVLHVWIDGTTGGFTPIGRLTRFLPDLAFGVTLFFTLSGFLLYRPFVASLLRAKPRPRFAVYLRNRILRIVPAYWVIFLLAALVLRSVLVRRSNGDLGVGHIARPDLLAQHLLLVQHYEPATVATGVGPAWSLAVEVVFYLALPLLVMLAFMLGRHRSTRRGARAAALVPPLLLLALGLAGKATAAYLIRGESDLVSPTWHTVVLKSFFCQADLFSFGMIVAVLRVDAEDGLLHLRGWRRLAAALAALAAWSLVARSTTWGQLTDSYYNTLMALACALLLSLVVLRRPNDPPTRLVRMLEWRPLVAVGLVSYSLFLVHEPVIFWLRNHQLMFTGTAGFAANVAVAGGLSLALAALSYRLVELPALRRKRGVPPSTSPLSIAYGASAAP